jgi:hypothetical protein
MAEMDNKLTGREFGDHIHSVLTPRDLHEKLAALIAAVKNPDIITIYGNGHLLIGHKKIKDGLAISTDGFGVWEITKLVSTKDRSYELTDNVYRTENSETVIRALAGLLISWEEKQ